jgi:hypothetical protein
MCGEALSKEEVEDLLSVMKGKPTAEEDSPQIGENVLRTYKNITYFDREESVFGTISFVSDARNSYDWARLSDIVQIFKINDRSHGMWIFMQIRDLDDNAREYISLESLNRFLRQSIHKLPKAKIDRFISSLIRYGYRVKIEPVDEKELSGASE